MTSSQTESTAVALVWLKKDTLLDAAHIASELSQIGLRMMKVAKIKSPITVIGRLENIQNLSSMAFVERFAYELDEMQLLRPAALPQH